MNRRIPPIPFAVLAVLAVVLPAFTVAMPSSSAATIDPQVVAESIAEDGYYIDSGAKYLRTDVAQDRLRYQLERSRSPVFVAVIPAGDNLSPTQVYHLTKRKGTYAVLTGNSLRAASNTLSASRVNTALTQAIRTHRSDPGAAVVAFVSLTNGTAKSAATGRRHATAAPSSAPATDLSAEPTSTAGPSAATPTRKDSAMGPLLAIGGILALVLAAGTGYLVYRRGRGPTPTKSPV